MNTANKDLCHGLYKLSGWGADDSYEDGGQHTPAYSLHELLNKLPQGAHIIRNKDSYAASYQANAHTKYTKHYLTADTAENAACMLATVLFETGVYAAQEPPTNKRKAKP